MWIGSRHWSSYVDNRIQNSSLQETAFFAHFSINQISFLWNSFNGANKKRFMVLLAFQVFAFSSALDFVLHWNSVSHLNVAYLTQNTVLMSMWFKNSHPAALSLHLLSKISVRMLCAPYFFPGLGSSVYALLAFGIRVAFDIVHIWFMERSFDHDRHSPPHILSSGAWDIDLSLKHLIVPKILLFLGLVLNFFLK